MSTSKVRVAGMRLATATLAAVEKEERAAGVGKGGGGQRRAVKALQGVGAACAGRQEASAVAGGMQGAAGGLVSGAQAGAGAALGLTLRARGGALHALRLLHHRNRRDDGHVVGQTYRLV
jgi:hypothetical protein